MTPRRSRSGSATPPVSSLVPRTWGLPAGANRRCGGGRARREGRAGDADYVLLLNNDVTVDRRFLDELVRAAEGLPDAAALCPKIYFHDRPTAICSTGGRPAPPARAAPPGGR